MRFCLAVSSDEKASCPPSVRRDAMLARAKRACEAGFDDIAVTHRYSTVDQRSVTGAGPVARLQPIATLAYLAGALGDQVGYTTSVLLSPSLHPIQLAEDVATLDALCAGSLNLGLGLGWVDTDFENFQIANADRAGRFEELVSLYRSLMTGPVDASDARYFPFPPRLMQAAPARSGGPPVWIGASSPAGVRRAAHLGDAWVMSAHTSVAELRALQETHLEARATTSTPEPREQPVNQVVFVAESHESARRMAEPELRAWYRQRDALSRRAGGLDAVGRSSDKPSSPRWIIGDPEGCAEQLINIVGALDVTYVTVVLTWLTASERDRHRAIDLLGDEVLPIVRRERASSV